LISSMYERLLHAKDPEAAKKMGAYYTPYQLAELMVNEIFPWPKPGRATRRRGTRVIDPSCGSGVFLVEVFRRLVANARTSGKALKPESLSRLLRDNIFGVDENPQAIRIAAFSLCLAFLDEIGTSPENWDGLRLPNLRTAPEGGEPNLSVGDAFDYALDSGVAFDFVVGNPPWKRAKLPQRIRTWLNSKQYPAAGEIAQAFMWLARELAPEGRVAMLSPSKWLFNREPLDAQFRHAFLRRNYVEAVINLSALVSGPNRLFEANAPATGIVFRPSAPDTPSSSVLYSVPRPPYMPP